MTSPWENPDPNSWKPAPTTPATGAETPNPQPQAENLQAGEIVLPEDEMRLFG